MLLLWIPACFGVSVEEMRYVTSDSFRIFWKPMKAFQSEEGK